MNGRRAFSILAVVVLLVPAWSALAQKPARPTAARAPATAAAPGTARGAVVATVGSAPLPKAELDGRTQQALTQYRQTSGATDLPPEMLDLLRRQVLESMIRLQLLTHEAARTGVRGNPGEAEQALKQAPVFNPGGRFDEARFNAVKTTQRPAFDAALQTISQQLGARKLYSTLEARYMPSEAEARAAATRAMSRTLIDHLSLRTSEFNGTYPEPREQQVVDWYAAHREDYRRPDRAKATVCFVNAPGLTDSAKQVPGATAAWTARMRVVADSVLASIRSGTPFDSAARKLGQVTSVVVTSDNFPGYWRGSAVQSARVFAPGSAGQVIPEAIPAAEGWLIVRVDELVPAHIAPLKEVAREIRALLRRDRRVNHEEYEQRALYAQARESMVGTGWKLRYVGIDTAAFQVPEPNAAELDRYYRGHQADYSSFDTGSGSIVARPLAEVRGEVRDRIVREARATRGRVLADAILKAWAAGKRDPASESRLQVRETPPIIPGSTIDTGLVAMALSDTLWKLGEPHGTGIIGYRRGWIVWQALERVEQVIPTFEQARPALATRLGQRRAGEELTEARKFFSRDSLRFNSGDVVHFTRFAVNPPTLLHVPLTRAEVEKWHHDHMDKYSAPELVTARHILVRTNGSTPEADRAALARAEDLLRRVQAGEDFAQLARANSDDPATRDAGGDLGAFGRGTMLAQFEKAAFALQPGEVCDHPVKTEVGYHIIKCTEHAAAFAHPLTLIYSNVSSDAAKAKGDEIARARADSLVAALHTPAGLKAAAQKMGYLATPMRFQTGADMNNPLLKPFFDTLAKLKPGQVRLPPFYVKGEGFLIAWVDSITAPVAPTWEEARERALAEYRRGAGKRNLDAKRAELDSLSAAGWSFDSLAALWGGPERALDLTPARGLAVMGTSAAFDSLVFGDRTRPGLPIGQVSDWITMPNGLTRVRVTDRVPPPADQLGSRAEGLRAAELERRLRGYFDDLKKRYPVKILDPTLRDVNLAEPPAGLSP